MFEPFADRPGAVLAALLVAACGGRSQPARAGPAATEVRASHERMLAELERVRASTAATHAYLGTERVAGLREALERLDPSAEPQARLRTLVQLAECELVLGLEDEAIEHYRRALEVLDAARDEPPGALAQGDDERSRLLLQFGVAWLRKAETQNCCNRWTPDSCILPIRGGGVHSVREPSERARELFLEVLGRTPDGGALHDSALWLANLATMTLGEHPDGLPEPYRIPPEAFTAEADFPRFVNRARELGLDTESLSGGAIADDFDGDADLDLFVTTWDTSAAARYFRNEGDGTFSDRSREAGLAGLYGGLNCLQADYDDDGDLDVLVLRGAWLGAEGRHPNSLLSNDGQGRFQDVTFAVGLGDAHWPTQTAGWADYDLDGDLDLYVGNEHSGPLAAPGQLFRNEGGRFVDVAALAGVTNDRFAKAVAWGDYDGDRLPDLFVSNLQGDNRLYRNLGDGTFRDVAESAGVLKPRRSFPAWFWDFDQDGALDLFVAPYSATISEIAAAYAGRPGSVGLVRLFRNDGQGHFSNVARDWNIWKPAAPMGSNFADLDGDGWPDFYLGTGYPEYAQLMPNQLYRNDAGRRFLDVTTAAGLGHLQKGHAVVFADFDQDGDLDLFEQMGGAFPGDAYRDALYENPGFGQRFLSVELRGTRNNRFGVGALLRVSVSGGGVDRTIHRTVNSGGSFGANPLRQTLGLGRAERIDALEVSWPVGGSTQTFREVPLDVHVRVTEGRSELEILDLPVLTLGG